MKEIAVSGLTTIASDVGFAATAERLEGAIHDKGLTVFAKIDHAAGATEVGLTLRPTTLIIFGNARGGTPLMQSAQTVGIDLPLKVLAWEDAAGKTWLSYNEPNWIGQRHNVTGQDQVLGNLANALKAVAGEASKTA